MQQLNHKGRILFVFSDPGGAKPILSLIENENLTNTLVVSDRVYSFYKDFKSKVEPFSHHVDHIIDQYKPNLIYTGTSYSSDIEKKFVSVAVQKGIPTVSFIDHWTSMRKRFEDEKGSLVLPDWIAVIDERAKQIAIVEGLDESRIMITGNPYHKWLSCWKPSVSKEQFMHAIGMNDLNKKIALYAPDPLSNVNGMSDFGFDEISATMEMVEAFSDESRINDKWICLIKAHPNQDLNKLKPLITNNRMFELLPPEIDTNTCMYYADIVIGFFSSFLIESDIMKKTVLRYLPKDIIHDPIKELHIGTIVNKNSIVNQLTISDQWN